MKKGDLASLSIALIICAFVLGGAYKYKYRAQETVVVTGLGEQEFTSDLIVWRGNITAESSTIENGYKILEANKQKVQTYIEQKGIPSSAIVFMFANTYKNTEPIYSDGNYVGQRFTGYNLTQSFSVESNDVEAVEEISREISSLIAQGVTMDSWQPDYYYTKLDDLKLELIEQATADAKLRAEKIALNSDSKLRKLKSARMGVFQITGANVNEEFSAGGSFNTSSKKKKARVTIRLEYTLK